MPTKTVETCDYCGMELCDEKYLIYKIEYWGNNTFKTETKDFLRDNIEAAMFCSGECMGVSLKMLFNRKKNEVEK